MKFLCLYVLLFGSLLADEGYKDASNQLFISLGGSCDVAVKLREHNLRTEAFPFDWLLTLNHERFLELLDDDFQFFLNENCIFQNPENPFILENKYYEFEFRHDWPVSLTNDLTCHLQEITSKYERRIARFRKLGEYAGKVIFIRTAYDVQNGGIYYWWNDDQQRITAEQAKTLKMALDRFFPLLDFTLVIINYKGEDVQKIANIDGVIEFKIRKDKKTIDYAMLLNHLSK